MFDIGVNLTSSRFNKDRDLVISKALNTGIKGFIIIGTNLCTNVYAQQLTKHYTNCWTTIGIHPHDSKTWTINSMEYLYTLARNIEVVAIGECGLDFYRNFSNQEIQEKVFIAQLNLAVELEKPVFLHCRNAYDKLFSLLDPWINKLPGAVLHCFTGTYKDAMLCLQRGIYLGITGWVCDKNRGEQLRTILPLIPNKSLMLGTDAPYLLPQNLMLKPKSNRNEPMYLAHILQQVSILRKESQEELENQIDNNVRHLFNIKF